MMSGNIHKDITGSDDSVSGLESDEGSVRKANIAIGRVVGELVRTTLGPRGMDKLLVDNTGMGIVTNNGASILREMVDHPVADLVVDVAISQEDEVSDGTTTAATIAAELLGEAEELIDQDIHPTTIAAGYLAATERAVKVLENEAIEIDATDTDRLVEVAKTAMAGKSINAEANIPELVVKAAQIVGTENGVDQNDVKIEKITGGRVTSSIVTDGVVLGKERADPSSPYRVEDADIAVINKPVESRELDGESNINISSATEYDNLMKSERSEAVALVDHLTNLGVDAVICSEDIKELPRALMAEQGIYMARRVDDEELRILSKATEANIISNPREMTADDLGHADVVEESDIGGDRKTSIEGGAGGEAAMLVLCGSTKDVVDELHRAVTDALSVVALALREPRVIPGGGAAETAITLDLRNYATQHDTREQLAIDAFADALEVIPRTLAENAGISPVDGVVNVQAAQSTGTSTAGIDGETGDVVDALEAGIVEPLSVKSRSIEAVTEAVVAILRIDDVLPRPDGFDEKEAPGEMGGF